MYLRRARVRRTLSHATSDLPPRTHNAPRRQREANGRARAGYSRNGIAPTRARCGAMILPGDSVARAPETVSGARPPHIATKARPAGAAPRISDLPSVQIALGIGRSARAAYLYSVRERGIAA